MEEGIPTAFELITFDLGENKYHKIITTCVMQEIELPAASDFDDLDALPERERIAMEVLEANKNKNHELELSKFRAFLESTDGFFSGQNQRSIYEIVLRVVNKLVNKGLVEKNDKNQTIKRLVNEIIA
jgi:hypothetical protein